MGLNVHFVTKADMTHLAAVGRLLVNTHFSE